MKDPREKVPVADRSDYPAFMAGCWTRLLRTAYLLVQDWAAAEDLTQAALVKAWLAWPRLDDDPEAYVRKIIVTTHVSWWRRRWRHRELTTGQPPAAITARGNVQWRLVSSHSGDWPADQTVSIKVPTGARAHELSLACAGPVRNGSR